MRPRKGFSIESGCGDRHQDFPVLVKFEKQTDGTRRRRVNANPDVESKFSKNNYKLKYTIDNYEQWTMNRGVRVHRPAVSRDQSCRFCDHSLNIAWCFRRAVERRAEGDAVVLATTPNAGARSSDCGSTCQPLMKAQRELVEESNKEGATSVTTTDCLGMFVTCTPSSKTATTLNEGELGFPGLCDTASKALDRIRFVLVNIKDCQKPGHRQ